jgi:X-X-X-Leu-X-X-Gly heptad repeat protein
MAEYSVAKLSSGVSKLRSGVSKLPESLSRLFGSKKTGGKNRKKRDSRKVK